MRPLSPVQISLLLSARVPLFQISFSWPIFIKCGMDTVPLKTSQTQYFSFSTLDNNNMARRKIVTWEEYRQWHLIYGSQLMYDNRSWNNIQLLLRNYFVVKQKNSGCTECIFSIRFAGNNQRTTGVKHVKLGINIIHEHTNKLIQKILL
jgi:hypothetical protein